MAVSGVLNNILKAHAGSFDIKENINIENRTFSAYARFSMQNEKDIKKGLTYHSLNPQRIHKRRH